MDRQENIKATERRIAVMKAYVAGKTIQIYDAYKDGSWFDTNCPLWNWQLYDYRVKPEGEE